MHVKSVVEVFMVLVVAGFENPLSERREWERGYPVSGAPKALVDTG
jgi:hypothetical protein